jgi:hypothetical protein
MARRCGNMVKKIAVFIGLLLLLVTPAWAVQELDVNADGKIDDALYSAYGNLSAEAKIGTGATQVSQGNHAHTGMVSGPGASTADGELVVYNSTGGYTVKRSGLSTGIVKLGANAVPAIATPGSDYLVTETDPVVGAITGIVKADGAATIAAAVRADYATAQIIGTNTTPNTTNPYTLDAANAYGVIINYGATGVINLPLTAATGMNLIIRNSGAYTITINPADADIIVRSGTAQAAGVSMTLSTGAGNFVALYYDGTAWLTLGYAGTLLQGS